MNEIMNEKKTTLNMQVK